ncbi:hypothetical protein B0H11DRAFT_2030488 [Mycena galericulata]|nr:hypothetical protein B0H11DRAFT_2030488 [Mycena galericulata]
MDGFGRRLKTRWVSLDLATLLSFDLLATRCSISAPTFLRDGRTHSCTIIKCFESRLKIFHPSPSSSLFISGPTLLHIDLI